MTKDTTTNSDGTADCYTHASARPTEGTDCLRESNTNILTDGGQPRAFDTVELTIRTSRVNLAGLIPILGMGVHTAKRENALQGPAAGVVDTIFDEIDAAYPERERKSDLLDSIRHTAENGGVWSEVDVSIDDVDDDPDDPIEHDDGGDGGDEVNVPITDGGVDTRIPSTREDCETCGRETPHDVRVEILEESDDDDPTARAFSREPYRVKTCRICGSEDRTRMNSVQADGGDLDYRAVLDEALETWGENLQVTIAIEELTELVTELARIQRGTGSADDVVEELADCEIMLDQLALIFGTDDVNDEIERKLRRLDERLGDPKTGEPITDGGRDQDVYYVVDEARSAVVEGPFEDKNTAAEEASDRGPNHIVATEGAINLIEMTSSTTVRWENDDVDIVTDGGVNIPIQICAVCHSPVDPNESVTRRGEPTHRNCTFKRGGR